MVRPPDWVKALSMKPQPDDQVIARRPGIEILLVRHHDATRKRRSRAYLITWWHRKDFYYGKLHDPTVTTTDIDYHVFIARQNELGVGALLVARVQHGASWLKWNRPGSKRPHEPKKRQPRNRPAWKFAFIGVLATRRKRGIARLLLDTAATHFGTKICEVAWGLPFQPDGEKLVRRLCPGGFWSG